MVRWKHRPQNCSNPGLTLNYPTKIKFPLDVYGEGEEEFTFSKATFEDTEMRKQQQKTTEKKTLKMVILRVYHWGWWGAQC